MSNSQGYVGRISKILLENFPLAAIRLQKKMKAYEKTLPLNCLAEADYSFKFYVKIKVKTKKRFSLNWLAHFD